MNSASEAMKAKMGGNRIAATVNDINTEKELIGVPSPVFDAVIELVEVAEDINGACDGLSAFNKKLDRLSNALSALKARIEEVTEAMSDDTQ